MPGLEFLAHLLRVAGKRLLEIWDGFSYGCFFPGSGFPVLASGPKRV